MFILQIKVPRALTGLNSCTHFSCTHFRISLGRPAHSPVLLPMTSAVVFLSTPGLGTMTPVKVVTIRST